jgi:YfiH family protein
MMLHAASLAALPGLRHAFFTRCGGVSHGVWASLNVGLRSGDAPERVAENRARAAAALGESGQRLVTARQVHGVATLVVTEPWDNLAAPEADALVTDRPGLVLGVLTADCGPVLLADAQAGVIGAAHAGWKGALGGIVESVVAAMTGLGADPARIVAALGPCIARPSYEVGPEFVARFAETDAASAACFTPAPGRVKALFDLKAYVAARLRRAGVERIEVLAHDTCAQDDLFFSFRRTTIRGEDRFGLQLSAIVLPA